MFPVCTGAMINEGSSMGSVSGDASWMNQLKGYIYRAHSVLLLTARGESRLAIIQEALLSECIDTGINGGGLRCNSGLGHFLGKSSCVLPVSPSWSHPSTSSISISPFLCILFSLTNSFPALSSSVLLLRLRSPSSVPALLHSSTSLPLQTLVCSFRLAFLQLHIINLIPPLFSQVHTLLHSSPILKHFHTPTEMPSGPSDLPLLSS